VDGRPSAHLWEWAPPLSHAMDQIAAALWSALRGIPGHALERAGNEPFIRKYYIDMSEFEPVQYHSFADFFDRRFRPGARKPPEQMGAFAEVR
jgi:phosphatidylserine decarboxylase